MNLGDVIHELKAKSAEIDMMVLYETPGAYYSEIIEIIRLIRELEEPILLDLNNKANA